MDSRHHLVWVSVHDDPMLGARMTARISAVVAGKKAARSKIVNVTLAAYRHREKTKKPISWYLPPTAAEVKKFNRSGDRFRMPGKE